MKTKTWRTGQFTCRTYQKPAGHGFEVGFIYDKKPLFLGNFIQSKEANQWYTQMNKEIRSFSKKYKVGKTFPKSWYRHFLTTHLYKSYYAFLDKVFKTQTRRVTKDLNRNVRQYKKLNKKWYTKEKAPYLKAA